MSGGVVAQFGEGADALCGGRSFGWREGGPGVLEDGGDEADGVTDGGLVDAEEGGGDVGGDAEVAFEEGGEEVVGGAEAAASPAFQPRLTAALEPPASQVTSSLPAPG